MARHLAFSFQLHQRILSFLTVLLGLAFAPPAVAASPIITIPPASQTIFLGDAVTFSVGASGVAPLSYQWFRVTIHVFPLDCEAVAGARGLLPSSHGM